MPRPTRAQKQHHRPGERQWTRGRPMLPPRSLGKPRRSHGQARLALSLAARREPPLDLTQWPAGALRASTLRRETTQTRLVSSVKPSRASEAPKVRHYCALIQCALLAAPASRALPRAQRDWRRKRSRSSNSTMSFKGCTKTRSATQTRR